MCGIAGLVDFEGRLPEPERLEAMSRAVRHRGPDDEACFVGSGGGLGVGLAHRRLSIIDLSPAGRQPMANADGSLQLVVNGEIYNFAALRRDLERRHRFRSASDCEAILYLYEEQGDRCVEALDGMYAFALWDARKGRVLLARDRLGKKPLYYRQVGSRLAFGSEIDALFAGLPGPRELAAERLPEYLALGYVATPETLLRGVRRVPPGSVLALDARGPQPPLRYWRLPEGPAQPLSWEDGVDAVRTSLEAAVRKRLVADVPVGAMLSGGLDSSVVVATMCRLSPGRVRTFSVGFEGPPEFSELAHARRVADHLGTDHRELLLGPQPPAVLDSVLDRYGEPFGDATAVPVYLLAKLVRESCPVALTGDGGDELFGGYARFTQALDAAPGALGPLARAVASQLPPGRLQRAAYRSARTPAEALLAASAVFDVDYVASLLRPELGYRRDVLVDAFERRLAAHARSGPLGALLAVNLETYLLDDLLPKTDLMTMAHAVEARCPLLDRDLVETAFRLPAEHKIAGGERKRVLRRVAAELLPREILERPKQGFSAPLGAWFRAGWRELAESALERSAALSALLEPRTLREVWRRHLAGEDWGPQVWSLVVLERWLSRVAR
jgi:asparagine synthase (glutamine-hydrolysing)